MMLHSSNAPDDRTHEIEHTRTELIKERASGLLCHPAGNLGHSVDIINRV
jgi:hypothetical protein